MPDGSITLQDIADAAGVSRATVSRALRADPLIPAATRERVAQVAERLGYRANPLVSALMTQMREGKAAGFSGTLALISQDEDPRRWHRSVPAWRHFHEGASARAEARGFKLEPISAAGFDSSGRRLGKILEARGISGVLLAPRPAGQTSGELVLDWDRFSVATTGHSVRRPAVHRVCHHGAHAVLAATEQLRRRGYRRVGLFLTRAQNERTDRHWLAGHLLAQEALPSEARVKPGLVARTTFDEFERWFRAERPDAILALADLGEWLQRLGLRCPEQVGWAHLNRTEETGTCAGIDQLSDVVGAATVDLLVAQLQRNERGLPAHPLMQLVEGRWVEGASVRRAS